MFRRKKINIKKAFKFFKNKLKCFDNFKELLAKRILKRKNKNKPNTEKLINH